MKLWGANGGNSASGGLGGYGAYVHLQMWLPQGQRLYVFCGGNGTPETGNSSAGGYNGGGWTKTCLAGAHAGSGGGMTHLSFTNNLAVANPDPNRGGSWDYRGTIAVAAGGGGARNFGKNHGGAESSQSFNGERTGTWIQGATQYSGWSRGCGRSCANSSAGGGGWYGGGSMGDTVQTDGGRCGDGGAGGSSHILTQAECQAYLSSFRLRDTYMYGGGDVRKPGNPLSNAGAVRVYLVERTH